MSPEPIRWGAFSEVVRNNGNLVIRAKVPGITPEDVSITLDNDVLFVSGHHERREVEEGAERARHQLRRDSFSHSMLVPLGVDRDAITATALDGTVEVTIPLPTELTDREA